MNEPKLIYNPEENSNLVLSSKNSGRRWLSYWPIRYGCIILCCLSFVIWYFKYFQNRESSKISDESWNFLLFTQSYPITTCIWWKIKTNNQECQLPNNIHAWTIHGIWPSNNDGEGPFHCRNIQFNETVLEPIKSELIENWISIEGFKNNPDFWKHEWVKHGTCAVEDDVIDSEITYFKLGLMWNQQWNLTYILNNAGITPNDLQPYTSTQIHDAVKSALGKSPYLHCYNYKDKYIISEIRLCISKKLELINCDDIYTDNGDCPSEVYLPNTLKF